MVVNSESLRKDKEILAELAGRYAEIAALPVQEEIKKRMTDINSLREARPVVLIDEVPWHELDVDGRLQCRCENGLAVEMELFFRRALLQWDYFPCDRYYEPYFPLEKTVNIEGGLPVEEDIAVTDARNYIVSHAFRDQLRDYEDIEKLTAPVVRTDPERDAARMALATELLGGALPARFRGVLLYHAPWDHIPRLHGVANVFYDLIDRPEFMHAVVRRFTENQAALMEQYERLGLLDADVPLIHCTPAFSGALPAADYGGGPYRMKDMWFRSMAQMFGDVSPALHKEFDLDYSAPLFAQCGLGYYGCCEALDNKLDDIKKIPNIRKIGVSPWANVEVCAGQIGGAYVFAHKPNPAAVAVKTDPELVRREIRQVLEAAKKYGLRCEFVLKDISTAGYDVGNLTVWDNAVRAAIDEYYR